MVVGLIGLVRFPRSPTLPLRHAAVLMSYLTFMFEIAEQQELYPNPAWGVTANILFRRNNVRFDLAYAKSKLYIILVSSLNRSKQLSSWSTDCFPTWVCVCTHNNNNNSTAGGGEDVDYALRVCQAFGSGGGGLLVPVPLAKVVHPFWPGSMWTLASHFFNWAIGDGGLLRRFPEYRYWSFPNLPETICLVLPLILFVLDGSVLMRFFFCWIPWCLIADILVDCCHRSEFRHRCRLLQRGRDDEEEEAAAHSSRDHPSWDRSLLFYLASHVVANLYVVLLECGRLYGHLSQQRTSEGFCRRFDWHCGKLPKAPGNFRQREAWKFGLFVVGVVVVVVVCGCLLCDESRLEGTLFCRLSVPV